MLSGFSHPHLIIVFLNYLGLHQIQHFWPKILFVPG